jgi:hypothetical protein
MDGGHRVKAFGVSRDSELHRARGIEALGSTIRGALDSVLSARRRAGRDRDVIRR